METVTLPLTSGQTLLFRQPDDGEAMRLLRLFWQLGTGDAAVTACYEALASYLITAPDARHVATVRQRLAPQDLTHTWSVRAHWLGIQLAGDGVGGMQRAIVLLTGMPESFLRAAAPPRQRSHGRRRS